MTHWTSKGWVVCLGAAWKWSHWEDHRYRGGRNGDRNGLDFVEETQARAAVNEDKYYYGLCLLECLAESMGETVMEQVDPKKMWRSLALVQRKMFAAPLNHRQTDIEPTSEEESLPFMLVDQADISTEEIKVSSSGGIVIPAAAFSSPGKPTKNVIPMPSFLGGGTQLHLEHDGAVEYTLPDVIPNASYMLTCRLVNVHHQQVPLLLTIETTDDKDDDSLVDLYSIAVEYTIGAWQTTTPVQVQVGPKSTLKFSREPPCWGLSIKDFSLEPC
jgi:hypothetical protein